MKDTTRPLASAVHPLQDTLERRLHDRSVHGLSQLGLLPKWLGVWEQPNSELISHDH